MPRTQPKIASKKNRTTVKSADHMNGIEMHVLPIA